jgi:hypothetical protein
MTTLTSVLGCTDSEAQRLIEMVSRAEVCGCGDHSFEFHQGSGFTYSWQSKKQC